MSGVTLVQVQLDKGALDQLVEGGTAVGRFLEVAPEGGPGAEEEVGYGMLGGMA
jgi:hypothetical protein